MTTAPAGIAPGTLTRIEYDDTPVRQFMVTSIFWGIIGMLVGVLIATQLGVWQANFKTSWLTFGRLRPLPDEKADRVRSLDDRDTLYLGDGANDSLAFD